MQASTKALGFGLLAVLFWSTAGSAFKLSLSYADPPNLLLIAVLTSFLVLLLMSLLQGRFDQVFGDGKRAWMHSALLGLLNPFLYYLILFEAYDRLLAQEAMVLNYLWPVILVLLSIPMLGQVPSQFQWAGILLGFSGTLVIASQGSILGFTFQDPVGVALASGSAFIWALYWLLNLKDQRESLPKLSLNFFFGLAYILVYILVRGHPLPSLPQALPGGVYIGLFEMGITFVLWLSALKYARNTATVSNLVFLSPLLSLFWIHLLVGEKILSTTGIGLALILLGIALQSSRIKANKPIQD
jgi:drug/metabolite transporter (DMT)-like permease